MDKEDVVHTMKYYSAIKKRNNAIVAPWMQLEIIILSEVRKRKTDTICYHLHVKSKIWLSYLWDPDWEIRLWLPRGRWDGSLDGADVNYYM